MSPTVKDQVPADRLRAVMAAVAALSRSGDHVAVVKLVESWSQEAVPPREAQILGARAFLHLRQMDRAWVLLKEVTDLTPEDVEANLLTAELFIERGWPARARKLLRGLPEGTKLRPKVKRLVERAAAPPLQPPKDAREIERTGTALKQLALAERYLATGSVLRARSILERLDKEGRGSGRVRDLLWGIGGQFLDPDTESEGLATLADRLSGAALREWEGADQTESVRLVDLQVQEGETAEIRATSHGVDPRGGEREPVAFPSLFRKSGDPLPGSVEEEEEVTMSAVMASAEELQDPPTEEFGTDPGSAAIEEDGGDTQILQVIQNKSGGQSLQAVDGPIHHKTGRPDKLRETLDLKAYQQSMGVLSKVHAGDEEFTEEVPEDDDLVIMNAPSKAADPPAPKPRSGPIEVVEKVPAPPAAEALPPAPVREPIEVTDRGWTRLLVALALLAMLMGAIGFGLLQALRLKVGGSVVDSTHQAVASAEYRVLLDHEAQLDARVRAEQEPLGVRAAELGLTRAMLWLEFTGDGLMREKAFSAVDIASQANGPASEIATVRALLALGDGDLASAGRWSDLAGSDTDLARAIASRVALARDRGAEAKLKLPAAHVSGAGVWPTMVAAEVLAETDGPAAARELIDRIEDEQGSLPGLVRVGRLDGPWQATDPAERVGLADAWLAVGVERLAPRVLGRVHGGRAAALDELGQHEAAAEAWNRALAADPNHPRNQYQVGVARFRANRILDAREALARCIEARPWDPDCARLDLVTLIELEQFEEARKRTSAWGEKGLDTAAATFWIEVAASDDDQALGLAIPTSPAGGIVSAPLLQYILALDQERMGQGSGSLAEAAEALSQERDLLLRHLGARAQARVLAGAEDGLRRGTIERLRASSDPWSHLALAQAFERAERRTEAAAALQRAAELGPESAYVQWSRGMFHFGQRGEQDAYQEAWRRFLDLGPSGPRADRTRRRLRGQ